MVLGYRYVLHTMAELESKGGISLRDLSGRMQIRTKELKNMLDTMEKVGHIRKEIIPAGGVSSLSCCGSCKNCSGCAQNLQTVPQAFAYQLTDKGRRVCRA